MHASLQPAVPVSTDPAPPPTPEPTAAPARRAPLASIGGDILLLGTGGKIGPTMAPIAPHALDEVGSTAEVLADDARRAAKVALHLADPKRADLRANPERPPTMPMNLRRNRRFASRLNGRG
jgi:hypothetical protein